APPPARDIPAPDPFDRMVTDLSEAPEIPEEEFFSRYDPGWGDEDVNLMPEHPPEDDWEPVPF
ncbi:MAG: hypothetical protein KC466_21695, partial [Myxococcales bacterium]|nr:hypothetical protein [Myxococcales bacterium]